jgi:hypothetical protein
MEAPIRDWTNMKHKKYWGSLTGLREAKGLIGGPSTKRAKHRISERIIKRGSTINHCRSQCKGREGPPLIQSFIHSKLPDSCSGGAQSEYWLFSLRLFVDILGSPKQESLLGCYHFFANPKVSFILSSKVT